MIRDLGLSFAGRIVVTALLSLALASFSADAAPSGLAEGYRERVLSTLSEPLLHQGLVNANNYEKLNKLSQNYPKHNTMNLGWLSVFRNYNSSETLQNRTALENFRSDHLMIFDMDGDIPLDWSKVTIDAQNEPSASEAQYALALDTRNIAELSSPVLLLCLSNQHTINDYLSNNAHEEIAKMGVTLAVLEYPGYGVSVGRGSKRSWLTATRNAVAFLSRVTQKKVYLLGHSIGGPLVLEAASSDMMKDRVAGAISYGGFTNIYEMSKDQMTGVIPRLVSKPMIWLTLRKNLIDGLGSIESLARNHIPTLILHGAYDGAVRRHHLDAYAVEISRVKERFQDAVLETELFPDLYHEEVNNYSRPAHDGFYTVWGSILRFLKRTPSRPRIASPVVP